LTAQVAYLKSKIENVQDNLSRHVDDCIRERQQNRADLVEIKDAIVDGMEKIEPRLRSMEDKFTSQDGGYKVLLLAGGAGGALMGMVFQFGPMVVRALRTAIPP
jgi:hypothetical protein